MKNASIIRFFTWFFCACIEFMNEVNIVDEKEQERERKKNDDRRHLLNISTGLVELNCALFVYLFYLVYCEHVHWNAHMVSYGQFCLHYTLVVLVGGNSCSLVLVHYYRRQCDTANMRLCFPHLPFKLNLFDSDRLQN